MRLEARAPVTWPTEASFQSFWRAGLDEIEQIVKVTDGAVVVEEGEIPMRLVGGAHLRPGATYRLQSPTIQEAELDVHVGGSPDVRSVSLVYLPPARGLRLGVRRPRVTAELDSLDRPRRMDVASNDPSLAGDARFGLWLDPVVDVRLRLSWLALDLVVRRIVSPVADELEVTVDLRARRQWRAFLQPLLALARTTAGASLEHTVSGIAENLTAIANGRNPFEDEPEDHLESGLKLVEQRMHCVADAVERRPWLLRSRRAWRRTRRRLPEPDWPPRFMERPWPDIEDGVSWQLEHTSRRGRRAAVDDEVKRTRAVLLEQAETIRRIVEQNVGAVGPRQRVTDDHLDLRWLRSPVSTVRKLSSPPLAPGADERAIRS